MKCEDLQLNLSIYLDDILTVEERAPVTDISCAVPVCRQKLADFQALRNNLRVLSRPQMTGDLLISIRSRVAQEAESTQSKLFQPKFLLLTTRVSGNGCKCD
jgi:hypothetical protein